MSIFCFYLDISSVLNSQLNEISSGGSEPAITYMTITNSPDAYILSGRYEVKDDEIKVKVNLMQREEKLPRYKFEVKGNKDDLKLMMENIVKEATEWIGKNK